MAQHKTFKRGDWMLNLINVIVSLTMLAFVIGCMISPKVVGWVLLITVVCLSSPAIMFRIWLATRK
jgi:hypothetical protein